MQSIVTHLGGVFEIDDFGRARFVSNEIDDVMSVQCKHANGYSSIKFLDDSNIPRLYVGHGNAGSSMANVSYIATRNQDGTPDDLLLCVFGPSGRVDGFRLHPSGDVEIGSPTPLATDATAGFVRLPTCNGDPTGTAPLGSAVVNSVDGKLCISNGDGTWTKQ